MTEEEPKTEAKPNTVTITVDLSTLATPLTSEEIERVASLALHGCATVKLALNRYRQFSPLTLLGDDNLADMAEQCAVEIGSTLVSQISGPIPEHTDESEDTDSSNLTEAVSNHVIPGGDIEDWIEHPIATLQ